MSEYLNKVLEFVETLSSAERINDGEYLNMMNSLKKINDSLITDEVSEERYVSDRYNRLQNTRFGTYERIKLLYLRPDADAPLHNITLWSIEFENIIKTFTGEGEYDNRWSVYTPLKIYMPYLRDEFVNLILFSDRKNPVTKRYIDEMLKNNLHWKQRLNSPSNSYIDKLSKEDLKNKKSVKTHIIKVDITSPFTETFCMNTKYIRLGKENNNLATQLNKYIVKKQLEDSGLLTVKYIKIINHTLENFDSCFHLDVSGIDAKTRTQKRQYSYNSCDFRYKITYLTK